MLLKDKWLWFNGKMDEETIKEKGWSDDPFDGLKIMKNDMQIFFNADKDLQKSNAQIRISTNPNRLLKRCMENITWRHQTIKNTIEWRKFMAVLNDLSFLLLYTTKIHDQGRGRLYTWIL